MNQAIHRLRLFLCTFSGEDDFIIRRCQARIQVSFASIGVCVILIFIGCWFSADKFMDNLFLNSKCMSAFVGIIWAFLVTNLYLLLLYTISPAILPVSNKKRKKRIISVTEIEKKNETGFIVSFSLRIFLLILLAIIIAQPINVLLFLSNPPNYAEAIRQLLSNSNESSAAWFVTAAACLVFLLPVYWKYSIRKHTSFYEMKKNIENRFVQENYLNFKEEYAAIFKIKFEEYNTRTWNNLMPLINKLQKVNPEKHALILKEIKSEMEVEPVFKYEYWADPPFRTKTKELNKNISSEEDFLQHIYS